MGKHLYVLRVLTPAILELVSSCQYAHATLSQLIVESRHMVTAALQSTVWHQFDTNRGSYGWKCHGIKALSSKRVLSVQCKLFVFSKWPCAGISLTSPPAASHGHAWAQPYMCSQPLIFWGRNRGRNTIMYSRGALGAYGKAPSQNAGATEQKA